MGGLGTPVPGQVDESKWTWLTPEGFEFTFGCNYLGPWLLTDLLLPLLRKGSGTGGGNARVINVSSEAHNPYCFPPSVASIPVPKDHPLYSGYQLGMMLMAPGAAGATEKAAAFPFDKLRTPLNDKSNKKKEWYVLGYSASKLAQVLHVRELAKREPNITAIAVHPGEIDSNVWRDATPDIKTMANTAMVTPEDGAKTQIHAALAPGLPSGCYIDDFELETWANPVSRDPKLATALWDWTVAAVQEAGVQRSKL